MRSNCIEKFHSSSQVRFHFAKLRRRSRRRGRRYKYAGNEGCVKKLKTPREKRRTWQWDRIDCHADVKVRVKKMLAATDAEQGANNSVIVSQLANSHTPQDFTVSRLLSTPTHSLGKEYKTIYFISL